MPKYTHTGVITSGKHPKGAVLRYILELPQVKNRFSRVVFVDNGVEQIKSVYNPKYDGVKELYTIHFTGVNSHIKHFYYIPESEEFYNNEAKLYNVEYIDQPEKK